MSQPFVGRWIFDHEDHQHSYSHYQKQLKHKRDTGQDLVCVGCKHVAKEYMRDYRERTKHARDHVYEHRKRRADAILRERHLPEWRALMALLKEGEDPG